ncbi:MAG: molybdenum cofactor guanylyltransferase [Nocardioides sp.]
MPETFCAVVLAGGTGARLGGLDKATVEHDGSTLLEHCLAALADAVEIVVVGPAVPTSRPVTFTLEDPPGGGPAAGLLAGRDALPRLPQSLAVLAVDMPYVDAGTFRRLREAWAVKPRAGGAFLVDADGRRQLAGVLDPALLGNREDHRHLPMHALLDGLDLVPVSAVGREATDIDTWGDVHKLRSGP